MEQEFVLQLFLFATFYALVPALVALVRWNRADETQRYLRVLVWAAALVGIGAHVMARVLKENNLFLLHFYTILEFILLTLIFRNYLPKKFVWWIIGLFSVAALINSVFIEKLGTFNVIARSVSAFLIMCYVMRYFWITLRDMKMRYLERQPMFWISCGALLYYAASFFIFIFSNDILPLADLWWTYWGVHAIFTILVYTFYSIALWVGPQQQVVYPGNYSSE